MQAEVSQSRQLLFNECTETLDCWWSGKKCSYRQEVRLQAEALVYARHQ